MWYNSIRKGKGLKTMITKTYMIPEENVENLEKKFNAAARKIRKINPELEPTMTKSNHTVVLVLCHQSHNWENFFLCPTCNHFSINIKLFCAVRQGFN